MPYVTRPDGCRIYYEIHGRGEPLLLIAGAGGTLDMWARVLPSFERRHRVLVYDHRGVGKSDAPTEPPYSVAMFAADAIGVLDAAGVGQAHVYGASLGGRIAQMLAIRYPDRLGAVILGCTSVGTRGERRSEETNSQMRGGDDPQLRLRTLTQTLFTPEFQEAQPQLVADFMRLFLTPKQPHVVAYHMSASDNFDSWDDLPSINRSVLVIHGTDDPVNPVSNAHLLAERIPGAELHLIEGGRHGYFLEFHPAVTNVALAFIARHQLPTTSPDRAAQSPRP